MLTINEKLRSYRLSSGLSQEAVANKLGMKRTTITAIENGDRKILAEELFEFSKIYHVPVETLLNSNDENEIIAFVREFTRLSSKDKQDILNFIRNKNEVHEIAF